MPRRSLTRALVGIWPKWPTRCSVEKSMNPPIDAEARMRRTGLARSTVIAGLASLGLAGRSWARAAPTGVEKKLVVETGAGWGEAGLCYPLGKGRWTTATLRPG